MRRAILCALAFGAGAPQAAATEVSDVADSTVYVSVTGDVMSEHAVDADGSSLYGTSCTISGTGFIVSPGGHVVTARHLLTDEKCEGHGMEGAFLANRVIRAWRGPTPQGATAISGGFVEGDDDIVSEDVALIDLFPSRPSYRPLRICVDYLTGGEPIDAFGYLEGGPLVRRTGQYGHDAVQTAAGATRLLLLTPTGDGMSGGPVLASGGRAIGMVVSSQNGDPSRSYASSMVGIAQLITRRTNVRVPECERRPEPIERVGLLLDRSAFYLTQQQTGSGRNEANSQRLGGFLATYASNRDYFAQEFLENEDQLIEILGNSRRAAVTDPGFYNNPSRFFDLLSSGRQAAGRDFVSAVLAYSENAWFLARFQTAEDVLLQALVIRPHSMALVEELLNRRSQLEDFDEIITYVRAHSDLLDATPQDVDERRHLINVMRYFAWALWERATDQNDFAAQSNLMFESALGVLQQSPDLGSELRYQLLNDRVPLYVLYLDRTERARADAHEAYDGFQRLLGEARADGRAADIRRFDLWLGRVENNLSWIYSEMGDLTHARQYVEASLERKRRATPAAPLSVATSLVNAGAYDVRLGAYEQGLQRLLAAEEHYEAFRNYGSFYQVRAARLHKDIALAYLRLGDRDQARRRLERGLRELDQLGERRRPDYLRTQVLLGYYHLEGQENFDALQALRVARDLQGASRDADIDNLLDLFMGEALIRSGFAEAGLASVQMSLDGMSEADRSAAYVLFFPRAELIERARGVLAASGTR